MVDRKTSNRLIVAVRKGEIKTVRELLASYSLSSSSAWSDGYVLLRDALEYKCRKVTQLLLTYGPKVNSPNNRTTTPLHFAVINGDIDIVQKLLDRDANINAIDQNGETPLHTAVESKKMKIIELLIKHGAYVNSSNDSNITPLHLAVRKGITNIVKLLLSRDADIHANGQHGTPLHIAAENGNLQIVELLLKYGAHVNSMCSSITPLQRAVARGHTKVVKLLLERGANVDIQDKDGRTVLCFAVENGHSEIVEDILKHCPDVNSKSTKSALRVAVQKYRTKYDIIIKNLLEYGFTVNPEDANYYKFLHAAVARGHTKVVKLLLERGANVDIQDKAGRTVLCSAVENGHSEIVEEILKHCPDVNSKSTKSALRVAVQKYRTEYDIIIKNLLQYGFTVNPEDANDYKFLHAAVEKGYLTIVEQLLKYGAHVNILYNRTSGKSCMPLHTAIKNKQEEVAELLISHGADVNARDTTENTPIFYATENTDLKMIKLLLTHNANVKDNPELLNTAVRKNCREIIELFLQHGADVNASDTQGIRALHWTALNCWEGMIAYEYVFEKDSDNIKGDIAKLLLSRGANVNAQVKNGTTLHAAICKGYVKVVEALLEYNADVNLTRSSDRTPPLSYAAEKGNKVITKMLLNKGANINAKDIDGRTALHIATEKHHKQVVEVLLKFGARVDSKTTKGSTPLHIAVRNGDSYIAKVLVTFGGDIDSKDEFGATALHSASKEGNTQIVLTLLDHGADITIMFNDRYTALDLAEAAIRSFYSLQYKDHALKETVKILKLHMVRLKTANLYARNQHLLSIISDEKFSSFQNKCEEEIISMKSMKVGNANITFYNILTKGISQLAVYAGNESVVQVLRSKDYEVIFPIYASTISTHFRNGESRKELLEEGNTLFHSFFNYLGLPHVCTERIFNYLSDADLRTLMDACKPINVSNPDIDINNVIVPSNVSKISYA